MEAVFSVEALIAYLTLASLEIVLGIDNVVFITILVGKLPEDNRLRATRIGLSLAMIMRILLLLAISWVMRLTEPLFTVFGHEVSGRDLILLGGGLFLIAKSTFEIHDKLEAPGADEEKVSKAASFGMILIQVLLLDMVFSLDSVITAVGMTDIVPVMIAAIVTAVIVMMVFAGPIEKFVSRHPTIKMLALAFLILIGVMLVAEGLHKHIERGYIYFAMAFSLGVEFLNMRMRKVNQPVKLYGRTEKRRTAENVLSAP